MKIRALRRVGIGLAVLAAIITAWLWLIISDLPDALRVDQARPVGVLLDNVRLISMVPGSPEVEDARAVLIMGDRIIEVGAAGALRAPQGVRVVDGNGRTLIPGLIDAHIHLNDEAELAGYLAHGVTGVRNMSGYPFHLRLAERIANGALLGPDFITTGPILNSPGANDTIVQQTVTSGDEARASVRAQHAAGYRTLKIYSNLTREAFEAIIDEADRLGMSVTGHSPEGVRTKGVPRERPFDVSWEQSLGRGFTTLEHVETIVWHGLRDDLDEDKMRLLASRLSASGEVVTPTLIAHKRLVLIAETQGRYLDGPGSDTINPLVRFFERGSEQYWSGVEASNYERPHADFFLTATRLLHEAGVPLIAGTDSGSFGLVPGASLARELELLVAAGLSPHDALASATRSSAEALGFERSGIVAPGYRANLVLLIGDPLTQIGAVELPSGVMVGGHWIDEAGLEAMRNSARDTSFVRSLWRVLELKLSNHGR
ncbi:amidohydrolase family protein [uncultured Brevundimonas sp.]|uniref:amidohydrolase family protein n=1 Tax=uncultured Brevundimonas sp. TaxID=213418 RepID=UPI0030ED6201|tara:strand:+ start:657 stop:2117 length:1461 start_codon:yes stop_codon:yes gene_type:complete